MQSAIGCSLDTQHKATRLQCRCTVKQIQCRFVAETHRGCPMALSVFLFAYRERWMHNCIQIDFSAKLWQQQGLKSPMGWESIWGVTDGDWKCSIMLSTILDG